LLYLGYSLQLSSPIASTDNRYPYSGQWWSKVLQIYGSQLCLSIDVFVPDQLDLSAELHSNATTPQTITVFDVHNDLRQSELNLVTEVQLKAQSKLSLVQLDVYVSDNTIIRKIQIYNGSCSAAMDSSQSRAYYL
jgi:hypothetical protein